MVFKSSLNNNNGGGGGSPGGSNGELQYNNNGSFGGTLLRYTLDGGGNPVLTSVGPNGTLQLPVINGNTIFEDAILVNELAGVNDQEPYLAYGDGTGSVIIGDEYALYNRVYQQIDQGSGFSWYSQGSLVGAIGPNSGLSMSAILGLGDQYEWALYDDAGDLTLGDAQNRYNGISIYIDQNSGVNFNGGAAVIDSDGNFSTNGIITEYNGQTTYGIGAAYICASPVYLTGQTGSIAATAIMASPQTGMYRANISALTTTAGSLGTVAIAILCKDNAANPATYTIGSLSLGTLDTHLSSALVFRALSGVPIQYSATKSGGSGSPVYELNIVLEKIG